MLKINIARKCLAYASLLIHGSGCIAMLSVDCLLTRTVSLVVLDSHLCYTHLLAVLDCYSMTFATDEIITTKTGCK